MAEIANSDRVMLKKQPAREEEKERERERGEDWKKKAVSLVMGDRRTWRRSGEGLIQDPPDEVL